MMSFVDDGDRENNHWHDPSCDHQRARPLDFGSALETPQQYANRIDQITNDPRRIEKRKRIAPAFTVPRRRANLA